MTAFRNLAEKSKVAFSDKYMLGFVNLLTTEVPIVLPENGEVYLKVCVSANVYQYSYSLNGTDWEEVGPKFESYKLSDDYVQGGGFFTGAFVGMHCVDLVKQSLPADFEYFRYQPK